MHDNPEHSAADSQAVRFEDRPNVDLAEEDILDAMRQIPGYIDITTSDFRIIYERAHAHAMDRLLNRMRARDLMRASIEPLTPGQQLVDAARILVRQGLKSLPVIDAQRRVVGMFTETDVLRQLGAQSLLALLLAGMEHEGARLSSHAQRPISAMMTSPTVTVAEDAGFHAIMEGFHNHAGRSMPVIDAGQQLVGLLLRKDFVSACHLSRVG